MERTVFPQITFDDVEYFTLWGALTGNTETELIPSFTTEAVEVALAPGSWDFTVKGYKSGHIVLQGKLLSQAISSASSALTFSLSPLIAGTGSIAITINLPAGSGVTTAAVFKDGVEESSSLTASNNQITYNAASVSAGDYYYSFRLKNSEATVRAVVSEVVQVREYLTSSKTITLNQTHFDVAPDTPTISSIESGDRRLTVTWNAVASAVDYAVYYSDSPTPPNTAAESVNNVTTTINSLTNGTLYYVWVRARNTVGSSGLSGRVEGTPSAQASSQGPAVILTLVPQNDVSVSTQSTTILQGESGTFTVPTTYASYQWYLDGTAIPAATVASYTLNTTPLTPKLYELSVIVVTDGDERFSGKCYVNVNEDSMTSPSIVPGLYDGAIDTAHHVGDQNLSAALTYIQSHASAGKQYYIVVGAPESLSPTTLSYSGQTVGITLVGSRIERSISLSATGSLFTIGQGVTLTLDSNIALESISSNNTSLVRVAGGTLVMNAGSVVRGSTPSSYALNGISIEDNGTFTMNGGEISGNSGSGVFVSYNATFTMNGGKVSGNTGNSGVYVQQGTFTMNGGKVSGNSGNGGVYVSSSGIFTMSGGEVSSNYGSGVYVSNSGTFTMSGGEVSDNSGSGVSVQQGTVTMSGGKVSGNTANSGGGVCVYYGTFTMSNGEISGNTASNSGGGVYIEYNGTFTMSGGKVSGNTASSPYWSAYGGGIYVSDSGTFTMSGGQVSGNTASSSYQSFSGGGVYVQGSGTFTKSSSGGTIYGSDVLPASLRNTAGGEGDTVYVSSIKKRNSTIAANEVFSNSSTSGWD
jgi:parallel beta-helix repeat protein